MGSRFEGKIALITGAASGIGAVIAGQFSAEGASFVLADIDDVKGEEVARAIRADVSKAIFVHHDVRNEE